MGKQKNFVDFVLTQWRSKGSAQKFLNKAIRNNGKPGLINIDKSGVRPKENQSSNNHSSRIKKIESAQSTQKETIKIIRKDQLTNSRKSWFATIKS